jgi:hypothetical protein
MLRALITSAIAAQLGACVLPPVRASAGGGGGAGGVILRNSSDEQRRVSRFAETQLRMAFTPMTLGDRVTRRRGDLSLGWSLDWQWAGPYRHVLGHGPYAEAVWFVGGRSIDAAQRARFGATALAELRLAQERGQGAGDDQERRGWGVAFGGIYELASDAGGPIFFGRARGELGIGLSGRVGLRRVDGEAYTYAVVSVEIRTPGMATWFSVPTPRPR